MPVIAHLKTGKKCVILPDIVANDQKHWDATRKPFFAILCDITGKPLEMRRGRHQGRTVVLRGDLYGLHTTGTGDPVVSVFSYGKGK